MITGVHAIVFTEDAEADRAFFGDVLKFPWVDAGHGWLTTLRLPGAGELELYEPRHASPILPADTARGQGCDTTYTP